MMRGSQQRIILLAVLLQILTAIPLRADTPCQNEDGYRPHAQWRGDGSYASTINLLPEGSSFETGVPRVGALDGFLYCQYQFLENMLTEDDAADAFLAPDVDESDAVHGSRSLRIDFTGPYPTGGPAASFELSSAWFDVPDTAQYDISFYARTNKRIDLMVNLIGLDTCTDQLVWVDLDTTSSVKHARFTVDPGGWQRCAVRTPSPLPASTSYVLRIWSGSPTEPNWCVQEGTTLHLDAVQVARAPIDGGAPRPYQYHTQAEELFLAVKGPFDLLPKWDNLFFAPAEVGAMIGRVEIYQDPAYAARGGGIVHWKLYTLFGAGDPAVPIGSGEIPVTFPTPRQDIDIDLHSWIGGRLGVYKWIVEFEDSFGLRADREEITFALVRGGTTPAPGGNFGVNLGALGAVGPNETGNYSPTIKGPFSLRRTLGLVSRLGFTQARVFSAFDWGTTMEDPANPARYDFFPDLAAEYGISIFPVISSLPSWWNGSDWLAWHDFVQEQVDRYGPGGLFGTGMTGWNIFNEMFMYDQFTPEEYAQFLFQAEGPIHQTSPPGQTYISVNGWNMPEALISLLTQEDDNRRVHDILDGVGVNRYLSYDPTEEEIAPPEEPSGWHAAVPNAVWVQRSARLAFQLADTAGSGTDHSFPLTETGADVGSLLADRRSRVGYWEGGRHEVFANSLSGSLAKAERGAARLIRHEILALAEGHGPVSLFGYLPRPRSWASGRYGCFQIDHTPAAPLAAQVQLNRELGTVVFVRRVPAEDLHAPGGVPNLDPGAQVLLFHDPEASEYVIVSWTTATASQVEFDFDPGTYGTTARDIQGNPLTVTGSGSFTWSLVRAPTYIRVDDAIGAVALTEAIDHRRPTPPTWLGWREHDEDFLVRFSCPDPGDLGSLALDYRAPSDSSWTRVFTREPWAHPDSSYTVSFPIPPCGPCLVRAVAIEKTTGYEVASETLSLGATAVDDGGTNGQRDRTNAVTKISPNPTHGATDFVGMTSRAGDVTVEVHDPAGRLIRRITLNRTGAGPFRLTWDGRDRHGRRVPSGVYFIRFSQEGTVFASRRVILVR